MKKHLNLKNLIAASAVVTLLTCATERVLAGVLACLFTVALLGCAVAPLFIGKDE